MVDFEPREKVGIKTKKRVTSEPEGWDKDKTMTRKSIENAPTVPYRPVGDGMIKMTCPNCRYNFQYNTAKASPTACPYCGVKIKMV